MATTKKIKSIIESSIGAKKLLCESKYLDIILKIAEEITSSLKKGGKLIVFGNGGTNAR